MKKKLKLKKFGPGGPTGDEAAKKKAEEDKKKAEDAAKVKAFYDEQAAKFKALGLPVPTAKDSLAVYQNSLALQKFYSPDKGYEINESLTSSDRDEADTHFYDPKKSIEVNKGKYEGFKLYSEYGVKNSKEGLKGLANNISVVDYYGLTKKDYLNAIEKNKMFSPYQFQVQDNYTGAINPKAPVNYQDFRIRPDDMKTLGSGSKDAGAITSIAYYDPASVKPFYLRTEKEKEAHRQRMLMLATGTAPTTIGSGTVPTKPLPKYYGETDPQTEVKLKTGLITPKVDSTLKKPSVTSPPAAKPYFMTPTANAEGSFDIYEPDRGELIDVVGYKEAKAVYNPIYKNSVASTQQGIGQVTPTNTKFNNRYLKPNTNYKKPFAMGGSTKSALLSGAASLATSFIPGVGPMLAPLAGSLVAGLTAPEETNKNSNTMMSNPFGLKYGGKTPSNLKALHGGSLKNIAPGVALAKGRPHSKGGIKGDTDNDNKAEIEFEGGELFLDKEQYMINKDISKKYIPKFKALSGKNDSVAKHAMEFLKTKMMAENETFRTANTTDKFWGGGPTVGDPAYTTFKAGDVAQSGVMANGMNKLASTNSKSNPQGNSLKLTPYDKVGMATQMIAPVANLALGLTQKAEVVKPTYNPYNNTVLNNLSKMKYNNQAVENEVTSTFNAGMASINNSARSSGARLSNINNLYSNMAGQKALAKTQGMQMTNNILGVKNDTLNNLGQQDVAAKLYAKQMTDANRVAKNDYISTGLTQLSQVGNTISSYGNNNITNNVLYKTLQNTFGYKYNEEQLNQIMQGQRPDGVSDQDWIVLDQLKKTLN